MYWPTCSTACSATVTQSTPGASCLVCGGPSNDRAEAMRGEARSGPIDERSEWTHAHSRGECGDSLGPSTLIRQHPHSVHGLVGLTGEGHIAESRVRRSRRELTIDP